MEFTERILAERWQERYDRLKFKTKQVRDKDYEKVEQYLIAETEKLTS